MKRIIVVFSFVVFIIVIFLFINYRQNDIINKKCMEDYLFDKKINNYQRICYKDLIGLSIDGAIYDFYKYKLNSDFTIKKEQKFPNFNSMFIKDTLLLNVKFSYWKSTPINENTDNYPFNVAYFSNLNKNECSKLFLKNNYLEHKGNYYSFFSAYPIGAYLFIYLPKEKIIYIIHKKG